jgi:3-keto-L-gulonate-6-phosphate decarboxylase
MKNQTAISWLLQELAKNMNFIPVMHWHSIGELIEQAKEMEKEQIMDAYANNGWNDNDQRADAEQYYNQTYNL